MYSSSLLSEASVSELRSILRNHEQKITGTKAVLVKRIKALEKLLTPKAGFPVSVTPKRSTRDRSAPTRTTTSTKTETTSKTRGTKQTISPRFKHQVISTLGVRQLQDILSKYGQKKSGLKAELVKRVEKLREKLLASSTSSATSPSVRRSTSTASTSVGFSTSMRTSGSSRTPKSRMSTLTSPSRTRVISDSNSGSGGTGAGAGGHVVKEGKEGDDGGHPVIVDSKEGLILVESDIDTRLNAMAVTEQSIETRLGGHLHPVTLPIISSIAQVDKKLGEGAYGIVFSACVKGPAKNTCVQMRLPSGKIWTVEVALKIVINTTFNRHVAVYDAYDRFEGNVEVVREALIGRLMNRLVQVNITPHTGLLYVPIEMTKLPMIPTIERQLLGLASRPSKRSSLMGVATFMEVAEMDAKKFIRSHVTTYPPSERTRITNIMLLQLLQGLIAARTHLRLSHNDFHAENAMMNTVKDESWAYSMKVGGRQRHFVVPNGGMLWKIIDLGFATSEFFAEGETASIWAEAGHYLAGHGARTAPAILNLSPDLYDFGRMVTTLMPLVSPKDGNTYMALLSALEVAKEVSRGGELMRDLVSKNSRGTYDTSAIVRDRKVSSDPLREVFARLATEFEVTSVGAADAVFNTDTPLTAKRLSTFEARHLRINPTNSRLEFKRI